MSFLRVKYLEAFIKMATPFVLGVTPGFETVDEETLDAFCYAVLC